MSINIPNLTNSMLSGSNNTSHELPKDPMNWLNPPAEFIDNFNSVANDIGDSIYNKMMNVKDPSKYEILKFTDPSVSDRITKSTTAFVKWIKEHDPNYDTANTSKELMDDLRNRIYKHLSDRNYHIAVTGTFAFDDYVNEQGGWQDFDGLVEKGIWIQEVRDLFGVG